MKVEKQQARKIIDIRVTSQVKLALNAQGLHSHELKSSSCVQERMSFHTPLLPYVHKHPMSGQPHLTSTSQKIKKYFFLSFNNLSKTKNLIIKYKNLLFLINKRIEFFKLKGVKLKHLSNLF